MSPVVASSFALGSSAQGSGPVNVGIGPLSEELKHGTRDCRELRLAAGEWSLVIIHPGPNILPQVIDFQVIGTPRAEGSDFYCPHDFHPKRNKIYYAFVKCNGDNTDFSVHDLHGFLKNVGGKQAEQLEALSEGWPGFHFYDRSDIGEALQRIYI